MYELSGFMHACVLCAWLVTVWAEGVRFLEVGLQTLVSQHVDATNRAQTLCKHSYCLFYLSLALAAGTLLSIFMSMFIKILACGFLLLCGYGLKFINSLSSIFISRDLLPRDSRFKV